MRSFKMEFPNGAILALGAILVTAGTLLVHYSSKRAAEHRLEKIKSEIKWSTSQILEQFAKLPQDKQDEFLSEIMLSPEQLENQIKKLQKLTDEGRSVLNMTLSNDENPSAGGKRLIKDQMIFDTIYKDTTIVDEFNEGNELAELFLLHPTSIGKNLSKIQKVSIDKDYYDKFCILLGKFEKNSRVATDFHNLFLIEFPRRYIKDEKTFDIIKQAWKYKKSKEPSYFGEKLFSKPEEPLYSEDQLMDIFKVYLNIRCHEGEESMNLHFAKYMRDFVRNHTRHGGSLRDDLINYLESQTECIKSFDALRKDLRLGKMKDHQK